tara:strand:+ start:243 stop:515 length:273 start_codon:yes stop_codon:yes gene_type:complete
LGVKAINIIDRAANRTFEPAISLGPNFADSVPKNKLDTILVPHPMVINAPACVYDISRDFCIKGMVMLYPNWKNPCTKFTNRAMINISRA